MAIELPVERPLVPTEADLARARAVVAQHLPPTPLVASQQLGAATLLKLESAQPTGSFKVRGALVALSNLPPERPIVAASAGNHGLGVAWAAEILSREATVVVPETASTAKLEQLGRFRATTVRHGRAFADAERYAHELAQDGAHYLSPYNDGYVIAGQATIGAELEALPDGVTVVAPVGGGGLVAGLACWAAARPGVRLVGVEAAASPAMSAAIARRPLSGPHAATVADGVAGGIERNSITIELASRRLDEVVQVEEEDIRRAIRFLAREHGLVAEGAGAVAVAALLSGRVDPRGTVVAIVSGRNISLALLASILAGEPSAAREAQARSVPRTRA